MKSIACDLDGVIWDSHQSFMNTYNKMFNKNLTLKDFYKWGQFPDEVFWPVYNISSKQIMEYNLYKDIFSNLLGITNHFHISFLTQGLYKEGDIIKKLQTCGIYKDIIYDKIIIEDKDKKKVDNNFDFFIDDNPNMVQDIQKYPEKRLLLFDQPWNQNIDIGIHPNNAIVFRVYDWNDIYEYFMLVNK